MTSDQAAHVVEILSATDESACSGQTIVLKSTFEIPAAMNFAKPITSRLEWAKSETGSIV